jgi:cell division protein FtsW
VKRETTWIITVVLALVLLGVLMVYSASTVGPDTAGKLNKQLLYAGAGLLALFIGAHFDYHRLRDPLVFRGIVIFSLVLLVLVLIPQLGIKVGGARRWLGFGGFRFQPSEFAKFSLILLLAVKLTDNRAHLGEFKRGFLPPMLTALAFTGLVLAENDLGVPSVMMGVTIVMLCVAGIRWRYLLGSFLGVSGLVLLLVVITPHRWRRLVAFRNPWNDPLDSGFQLIQSMFGFAQGGGWGRGAGAGEQKLGYLDAAYTDFIFSVIGEELGLFGTLAVVLLFVVFLIAASRIVMYAADFFGAILATGITMAILLQAAFVMAVTTGLVPTKGLPLPFISYGGTALVVYLAMVGVLVNIGVQAVEPEAKQKLLPATQGG